jgi:hypothetical protein
LEAERLATARGGSRLWIFGAISVAMAVVLTAIPAFVRNSDQKAKDSYWILVIVIVVEAAIVYWIASRLLRSSGGEHLGRGALILSIVAFLSLAVFWLGLPSILAGAAALVGLEARRRVSDEPKTLAQVALVIAATTVTIAVVVAAATTIVT